MQIDVGGASWSRYAGALVQDVQLAGMPVAQSLAADQDGLTLKLGMLDQFGQGDEDGFLWGHG